MKPFQSRNRAKTQKVIEKLNQEMVFIITKVRQEGGHFLDRELIANSYIRLTFIFQNKKDLDGFVYLHPKWDFEAEGNYLFVYLQR